MKQSIGIICVLIGLGLTGAAQESAVKTADWPKPVWLTELSAGTRETYDGNVFLSGVDARFLPNSYSVPPGSVAALENHSSWVTTISLKGAVDFAPLTGAGLGLKHLAFSYAPEIAMYHDASSENNTAHRVGILVNGKVEDFSYSLDNSFVYVDGNKIAPVYPGNFLSAYGTAAPRERRDQIDDKSKVVFQYDLNRWFIRPTASLLYCGLMTKFINVPGYQNYPVRYDANGGADIGYRVASNVTVTAGYRYGHQYQEKFPFLPYSATSDYQRALLGLETTPWKWLTATILGGPDFRQYAPDGAGHITPVGNKHMETYYLEGALVATATVNDSVAFKFKQWQWVSSIGKIPVFDSTFDLSYTHKFGQALSLSAGAKALDSDYTTGNLPSCLRNDREYSLSASARYAWNSHLSTEFAYEYDLGQNAEAGVVNSQVRDFNRNLISLSLACKF